MEEFSSSNTTYQLQNTPSDSTDSYSSELNESNISEQQQQQLQHQFNYKRKIEDIDEQSNNEKKFKYEVDYEHVCSMCQTKFANQSNLKQHIEAHHLRIAMWSCNQCGKTFTSKSNLKVHLRVHTRIRPYHCKYCTYSCMHHSSIREHLAKVHPTIVHNNNCPGYIYNTNAVPDPEEFNSTTFNKDAFIAEAKHHNDKLSAEISSTMYQSGTSPITTTPQASSCANTLLSSIIDTPSSISPTSSNDNACVKPVIKRRRRNRTSKPKAHNDSVFDSSITSIKSENLNSSISRFNQQNPFSISSIIGSPNASNTSNITQPESFQCVNFPMQQLPLQYNPMNAWICANQMFYKMLFLQLQQQQQQHNSKNENK